MEWEVTAAQLGIEDLVGGPVRKPVRFHEEGACWICTSHQLKVGRGELVAVSIQRKPVPLQRLFYQLVVGLPPPKKKYLTMTCGRGNCLQVNHMVFHETFVKPGVWKLSPEQVAEIVASHETQEVLARKYGVSRALIGMAKQGRLSAVRHSQEGE